MSAGSMTKVSERDSPGAMRAAGVRAPAEVVARAVDHEAPGGGGQQLVQRTLDQRGAVLRPADPAGADVDHAGL